MKQGTLFEDGIRFHEWRLRLRPRTRLYMEEHEAYAVNPPFAPTLVYNMYRTGRIPGSILFRIIAMTLSP
jgi:hypothetical protein